MELEYCIKNTNCVIQPFPLKYVLSHENTESVTRMIA